MNDLTQELKLKVAKLEEEVKFKNGLISILSHDSKELFGNFLWLVEALEQKTITEDVFQNLLQQVKSDARKNLQTVQDSTAWLKTQYGDYKIKLEKILVKDLFHNLQEKFADQLTEKNLRFSFNGSEDYVYSDKILLSYILDKIVHNAIKYSSSGQEIYFQTETADDEVILSVIDTGTGMNEKYVSNVFSFDNPIFQGTAGEKGVGLSLKIVKNFLSLILGNIEILSYEGKSTTVSIVLPNLKA